MKQNGWTRDKKLEINNAKWTAAERRTHKRVELMTDVECEYEGQVSKGLYRATDVGVAGMFIDLLSPPPPGTLITVKFHLTQEGFLISAKSKVVYSLSGIGIGIKFLELDEQDREKIISFCTSTTEEMPRRSSPLNPTIEKPPNKILNNNGNGYAQLTIAGLLASLQKCCNTLGILMAALDEVHNPGKPKLESVFHQLEDSIKFLLTTNLVSQTQEDIPSEEEIDLLGKVEYAYRVVTELEELIAKKAGKIEVSAKISELLSLKLGLMT